MVKARVELYATDLKSFQVGREILEARQLSASPEHNGSSFEVNDQSVCWGFCSTNIPSLHDRSGGSAKCVLAKNILDKADSRDSGNVGIDSGSLRSSRVDKTSKSSGERHSQLSPSGEVTTATRDKHVPARSPSLR